MTEKELRRLGKTDLLAILRDQQAEIEALRKEREELSQRLDAKTSVLEECGSIAEASLTLSGVFQAAQQAADQYLEGIRAREAEEERRLNERRAQADRELRARLMETRAQCRALEADSREKAEQFWTGLELRLERLYDSHRGLREMLSGAGIDLKIPKPRIMPLEDGLEKDEYTDETGEPGSTDAGAAGTGAQTQTA